MLGVVQSVPWKAWEAIGDVLSVLGAEVVLLTVGRVEDVVPNDVHAGHQDSVPNGMLEWTDLPNTKKQLQLKNVKDKEW